MVDPDRSLFEPARVAEHYRRYLQPVLFDPWARRLVSYAGLVPGQTVLDVAAGTGAVARAAASVVGVGGRVIASDISRAMLAALAADLVAEPDQAAAPIDALECSAAAIALPDASVDVVLCHQGLPFMPDRVAVAREMRRVLRPGGTVFVAVWALGERLEPFDSYAAVVRRHLPDSPFARAMAGGTLSMTTGQVAEALTDGGFAQVAATLEHLAVRWPTLHDEARGIAGTPFGPEIATMDPEATAAILAELEETLTGAGGESVEHPLVAVFGRGTAAG
ncbi:methyltransferase domain-containing protein [Cryobacterium sp. PH31-AA6]|uniref:class I SAM-dependent methyltransferase n=1 Tax=Cryobacterium sp. PH31-AA6 TaxID=3046205 RepID=UPI0024BBA426|nr:methyltransferase domain-containing protein [Cryobacterium sp. PH31-AA6]MDJ0325072.1 methyltransferase domain-containing protein [Cryobacterium sp. PH31-AA6]